MKSHWKIKTRLKTIMKNLLIIIKNNWKKRPLLFSSWKMKMIWNWRKSKTWKDKWTTKKLFTDSRL